MYIRLEEVNDVIKCENKLMILMEYISVNQEGQLRIQIKINQKYIIN